MKFSSILLLATFFVSGLCLATGGGTSANGIALSAEYRTINFSKTRFNKKLPVELEVEFELTCNQRLIDVQRTESLDTGIVDIIIFGIVSENPFLDCTSVPTHGEWANAGTVFSGRPYEIRKLEQK